MTKITLTPLTNLASETTAVNNINNNAATIQTAMDNTLSRDGTSPNTMNAVIDMNSNRLINLPKPSAPSDPVRLEDIVGGSVASAFFAGIVFVMEGSGAVLATGVRGDIEVPFNCVLNSVDLFSDQTGSITLDIWKAPYATFPPVVGNSIVSGTLPNITSGTKSTNSTLTGWTTTFSTGDVLRFNINSVTNITRCTVSLKITRT